MTTQRARKQCRWRKNGGYVLQDRIRAGLADFLAVLVRGYGPADDRRLQPKSTASSKLSFVGKTPILRLFGFTYPILSSADHGSCFRRTYWGTTGWLLRIRVVVCRRKAYRYGFAWRDPWRFCSIAMSRMAPYLCIVEIDAPETMGLGHEWYRFIGASDPGRESWSIRWQWNFSFTRTDREGGWTIAIYRCQRWNTSLRRQELLTKRLYCEPLECGSPIMSEKAV